MEHFLLKSIKKEIKLPINPLILENTKMDIRHPEYFRAENEKSLQLYLLLHIEQYFPDVTRLLMYEEAIIHNRTDLGKVDFVFLTNNMKILLVETKYLDFSKTGSTAKVKRTKSRNKVLEQVLQLKKSIVEFWGLPKTIVRCGVFTNDKNLQFHPSLGVTTRFVEYGDFLTWIQKNREKI